MAEEKKEEPQEPRVPPVAPIVIEVMGDVDVTPQGPGVVVVKKD